MMEHLPLQSPAQLLENWVPVFSFTTKEAKFFEKEIRLEAAERVPPPPPKKPRAAPKIVINLKDLLAHRRNRIKFELSTLFNIPPSILSDNLEVLENPEYRVLLGRRQQQFTYLYAKSLNPPLNVSTAELARLVVRERIRDAGYSVPDDISRQEAKAWVNGTMPGPRL